MATFASSRAPEEFLSTQGSVAAEDLRVGWVVKLDPTTGGYLGCTAITDRVSGVVSYHSANPDDQDGLVPAGSDFTLVTVGFPQMRVKDGEALDPGVEWSPSDVKGHIQAAVATAFVGGESRESVSGTGQKLVGSIGINGAYFKP